MFAFAFGVGVWGLIRWHQLPEEARQPKDLFPTMVWAAVLGGIGMAVFGWFAYRSLKTADFRSYDSRDPDESKMKW